LNRLRLIVAALALLLSACATGAFRRVPASPAPVQTPSFRKDLATLAMTPWTAGNSVRTLENGDGFFPPMLRAAASAKHSITFECYTAADGPAVADISRVFAARARAGVKVHVILDAFGCCWWGRHHISAMRTAGVQVKFYSRFHFFDPLGYIHRTHRRVLVVDGCAGFCGGAGYGYNWTGHAEDGEHWRDTQYELHGPIVAQLQDTFNDNWRELTGTTLRGCKYYPPLGKTGTLTGQMVAGSPEKQRDTIGVSYLLAIRAARNSILMEQSYFIPPAVITEALLSATARGVQVQIIIPGRITDMPFAKEVAQHPMRRLIEGGVEIYEFQPTMMHGKLITIDDHLTLAGSGNVNAYSFVVNDENDLHVLNSEFAREQRRMFERDLTRSIRLTEQTLRISPTRRLRGFLGKFVFGFL
jgi:cardiolipin synthase